MLPEGQKRGVGDLDDSESDTGQISHGVTLSSESGNEALVVLVDEGKTTISGHEASDSLVVLLELDSGALSDGRVGLLGLDGNLFNNNSSGVRGSGKRFLPFGDVVSLLVGLRRPPGNMSFAELTC